MLVFILIGILRVKYSCKFCWPTFASLNFTLLAIFLHHVLLGWSCALELLKNELGIIKTCNLDLIWILSKHTNSHEFCMILTHFAPPTVIIHSYFPNGMQFYYSCLISFNYSCNPTSSNTLLINWGFPMRGWLQGNNWGKMAKTCMKITKSTFFGQNSGSNRRDKSFFLSVHSFNCYGYPKDFPLFKVNNCIPF